MATPTDHQRDLVDLSQRAHAALADFQRRQEDFERFDKEVGKWLSTAVAQELEVATRYINTGGEKPKLSVSDRSLTLTISLDHLPLYRLPSLDFVYSIQVEGHRPWQAGVRRFVTSPVEYDVEIISDRSLAQDRIGDLKRTPEGIALVGPPLGWSWTIDFGEKFIQFLEEST